MYMLAVDAVNFGSGWFPTLRKRSGCSGYFTVAWAIADRFRAEGAWSAADLRAMRADELADTLGQPRDHELMALYAQALRSLGTFLGDRDALARVREARRSGWPRCSRTAWRSSVTAGSTSAPRSPPPTSRSPAWRASATSTG
jgi:hypothetical protein